MTGVPVLLYHGIGDAPDLWTVSNKRFSEDVQAVLDSGRTVITVADYVARLRAGTSLAGLAVVSFDDGEVSQLAAAQELADRGPSVHRLRHVLLPRPARDADRGAAA